MSVSEVAERPSRAPGAPHRPTSAWILAVGVLLAALVACAPVLTTRYGYVDDYSLLFDDERGRGVASLGVGQGRPVAAMLQWLFLGAIDGVSGLVVMRLVSVLAFAAMGIVLGRAMLARGYTPAAAWTVAVGLFAVPSTAIMVAWSILFFGAVAALLGAAAAVLAVDPDVRPRARPYLTSLLRRRTLLALVLLCLAMLSYQPSAMVFWPCVFLMLAAPARRPGWRALRLPVWTATAVGGAALVVGFVGVKVGAFLGDESTPRADLVTDPVNKIGYLLSEVVPYALFPWLLDGRLALGVVVTVVLGAGLLVTLPGAVVDRLVLTALAGAAVVLGWLANLPIAENAPYSRTAVGVMVATVVIVGVVVDGLVRRAGRRLQRLLVPVVMAGVTVLAVAWTGDILRTYVTRPASTELERIEAAVRTLPDGEPVTVLTAVPTETTLAPRTVSDEFGRSTGVVYWALQGVTELVYRDEFGEWPQPGRFTYPSDDDYLEDRLREQPSSGWVLDYQRILVPAEGPAVYDAG